MADTTQGSAAPANETADKGKGKAAEPSRDVNMEGDDSSSEEELDDVRFPQCIKSHTITCANTRNRMRPLVSFPYADDSQWRGANLTQADEEDADNMEEIDTSNIINDGRRTRGRKIDFAKAAEQFPEEEDEDEEDDDDFEAPEDEDKMDE